MCVLVNSYMPAPLDFSHPNHRLPDAPVRCQFNGVEWEVGHRHREFQQLHAQVLALRLSSRVHTHTLTQPCRVCDIDRSCFLQSFGRCCRPSRRYINDPPVCAPRCLHWVTLNFDLAPPRATMMHSLMIAVFVCSAICNSCSHLRECQRACH